jgi:hypothetical protein
MLPERDLEALNKQAKSMFIRVYENVNGTNLYGYMPDKSFRNDVTYQKALNRCKQICRTYKDIPLLEEYKRNF